MSPSTSPSPRTPIGPPRWAPGAGNVKGLSLNAVANCLQTIYHPTDQSVYLYPATPEKYETTTFSKVRCSTIEAADLRFDLLPPHLGVIFVIIGNARCKRSI
ncbi:hypothetical protein V6Z96_003408 [Aspergillus fumigatus]